MTSVPSSWLNYASFAQTIFTMIWFAVQLNWSWLCKLSFYMNYLSSSTHCCYMICNLTKLFVHVLICRVSCWQYIHYHIFERLSHKLIVEGFIKLFFWSGWATVLNTLIVYHHHPEVYFKPVCDSSISSIDRIMLEV